MPTYQNNTAATISCGGTAWAAGASNAVDFFVPDEKGLTLTSEDPRVSATTLASGVLSLSAGDPAERIYIPDCNAALVSIVVKSGEITVQENYADALVYIPIDGGNAFTASYRRISVEALYITCVTDCVVAYNISRLS